MTSPDPAHPVDPDPPAAGAAEDRWEGAPVPDIVAVLPVADLDRSLAFYRSLGFEVRSRYDEEGYGIVGFEGAELHLTENPDLAGTMSWSGCYLRVGDAAEVHRRWIGAGAREVQPPIAQPYGLLEFATEDPDGNLWRVGSPLDAGTSDEAERPVDGPVVDDPAGDGPAGHDATAEHTPMPPVAARAAEVEGDAGTAATSPTDGSAGTTDASWYSIVAAGPCAGCGLDSSAGAVQGLGSRIRDEASRWAALLATDDDAIRVRPTPETWSALEYAAHVRDTLTVFADRAMRILAEDRPELGWWDHEAAIEDGWDNELEAAAVADDVARNAEHLATVLARVPADGWTRIGTRRAGEDFTVELLARFALHEVVHHRHDARASLDAALP